MSGAGRGAWPRRGGAELSESSPEPPSPSSSRPPGSDSSPSPSAETTPPIPRGHAPRPPGHAPTGAGPPCDRALALFEEELATRPRVPALLRRMAPYSTLSPGDSGDEDGDDEGRPPRRRLGTLRGVAVPALQSLLGPLLALRLPWLVGAGGLLRAGATGTLTGACAALTALSLSAIVTNVPDPGACPLSLLSEGLGPAAGGAVGVCAFLSAAFAAGAAALGAAEILLVYVLPQAAVLPGRGRRRRRLNNGRGWGAALLLLLALGAAAPVPTSRAAAATPRTVTAAAAAEAATALGPAGLLLALLGLAAGALRAALPGGAAQALCLPAQPGGRLRPCPLAPPPGNDSAAARPALPGPSARLLAQNLWPHPPGAGPGGDEDEDDDADSSFGALLGLSLPSAAGVLWGCSRCSELGDVTRSVPAGSLGAVLATALGYVGAAVLLGAGVEGALLRDKFGWSLRGTPVAGAASWPWPWLPLAGGLLAAAGAGLEALRGGSRLLRGLARARALPLPHALGRGQLVPLGATAGVAALGVLLGSLDLLAPVVSVLWLTSYLGLNLGCAAQGLLPTPGWSPRGPLYHWGVSLAGAGLCLGLMLASGWACALPALAIGATAYKYLEFRGAQSEWGEGRRGLWLSAARLALLRLEDGLPSPPSCRPQVLALVKLDAGLRVTQPQVLALAAQLGPARGYGAAAPGLTVLGTVLPGHLPRDLPRARRAEQVLREGLARAGGRGLVQVTLWPGDAWGALGALVQGCGLGALRPNTLLTGWPRRHDPPAARRFVELLRAGAAGGRALLVAKGAADEGTAGTGPSPPLDVWWVVGDGHLLTLLPRLLRRHPAWRGCRVRLFTVALLEDNSERLRRLLAAVARRRGLRAQTYVEELHDSDVSAYTYERTLMMEQRNQMLRQMRQAQGGAAPSQPPSTAEEEEEEEEEGDDGPRRGPSPRNVRRMHAAERLNALLNRRSGGSRLVLLDLPPPPPPRPPQAMENYLEFLEVLTEGLGPVLLVRGGDRDPPAP